MAFTALSIQSHVVASHVGNDAAAVALQRLNFEAWPIDTVQLSNHSDHSAWTGQALDAPLVRSLINGLDAHGYLQHSDLALAASQSVTSLYALLRGTEPSTPREPNGIALHDAPTRAPKTFAAELL